MKKNFTHILLAGVVLLSACKKDILTSETSTPGEAEQVAEIPVQVPFVSNGFNYNTNKDVKLNIALRTNNDAPLAGVIVNVYLPGTANADAPVFKGVTDKNGLLQGSVTIAATVSEVIIDPAYIGLMRNAHANISASNTVNAVIGGKEGYSGDIVAEALVFDTGADRITSSYKSSAYQTTGLLATSFLYPTGYTASNAFLNTTTYPKALGRPAFMESTADVLDASLLSYVNASLPENQPLTTTHPQYLAASAVTTLNVTAKTDVYVTFVSEGADQKNSLGYYTYTTGAPPIAGVSLIPILNIGVEKVTWVFPNASAKGSGGGLNQGDKVKLGNFAAGTSIAFFMVKNGWSGTDVNAANTKFYSNDAYNPGAKRQSIMLYDDVHKKFITSFEDIDRSGTGSDNDFNDLVFYSTASVANAISTTNVATVDRGGDTDGDGVQDALDTFPNDAARAYITYYPTVNTYGTIAFEDQWPNKGDYDMNDLVIGYRYTYEVSSQNKVATLKADYKLLAAGGTFKNGFGVQLPVAASAVASVTGQYITGSYVQKASNGIEAGQTNAVIIPFDNHQSLIPGSGSKNYMNTYPNQAKVTCTPINVVVNFSTPVALTSFTASSFNPFLIVNQERGREVHLPGYYPTNKANTQLFDTADDATVPAKNKYYLSLDNKPWALSFSESFTYPIETYNINKAYMQYNGWANSSGNSFKDWFSSTASGYRNASAMYSK